MKHKTWFRLVLKAIGILLVGFSIQWIVLGVGYLTFEVIMSGGWSGFSWYGLSNGVSGLCQLGLGLYLFFGGKWIVDKVIPSNRPYCPECGYDLSQASSDRCPECGVALPKQRLAK